MNAILNLLAAGTVVAVAAMPLAPAVQEIHAHCDGYQVVSSQSTNGSATFHARVDNVNKTIEYELNYKDLSGDIIQSHIHFSRPGSNGGRVPFLCITSRANTGFTTH